MAVFEIPTADGAEIRAVIVKPVDGGLLWMHDVDTGDDFTIRPEHLAACCDFDEDIDDLNPAR